MSKPDRALPDMGAVLGGMPHPAEKEIRRKECPGRETGYGAAVFSEAEEASAPAPERN
jgi:hypothetical protein